MLVDDKDAAIAALTKRLRELEMENNVLLIDLANAERDLANAANALATLDAK